MWAEPSPATPQHQGESFREDLGSAESCVEGLSEARASQAQCCLKATPEFSEQFSNSDCSRVLSSFLPGPNMQQNLAKKRQQCAMFGFRSTEFHCKYLTLIKKYLKSGLIFSCLLNQSIAVYPETPM